jgi:hypothetical protein
MSSRSDRSGKTRHAAAAALLACLVLAPGGLAAQPAGMSPAVTAALREAARHADAYDYDNAIAAARTALSAPGIGAQESELLRRMIGVWQERKKNPEAEDERITGMMRDGARSMTLLKACADIARVMYLQGKIAECTSAVGAP